MAIIQIQTQSGISAWSQRMTFDGTDYALDFAWNGRESAWYMSLSALDGTPIVTGLKLVSNRPLLRRFRSNPAIPPGEIMAVDLSATIPVAQYTDLSNGVDLLYFDASEGVP